MKTNLLQRKRLLTEESNRCYLCDAPVCTKACKPGLDPGRLLRACKMDNLAGAILRAYQMEACRDCDGYPCEKACLRGRTDRAISITQIVRQLQDMPNQIAVVGMVEDVKTKGGSSYVTQKVRNIAASYQQ